MGRVLLVLLLCWVSTAQAFTKKISQPQLQQKIDQKMPLQYQTVLFGIELTNAVVDLKTVPDAITLAFTLIPSVLGQPYGEGALTVTAKPRYDSETAALYLDDLKVVSLQVEGVEPQYIDQIAPIVESLLRDNLAQKPVYQFEDKGIIATIKKSTIKSVLIKEQELVIEWSPLPF